MKAESGAKVLIGVGIGIAFVEVIKNVLFIFVIGPCKVIIYFQVIGIILACWLASAIKQRDSKK